MKELKQQCALDLRNPKPPMFLERYDGFERSFAASSYGIPRYQNLLSKLEIISSSL